MARGGARQGKPGVAHLNRTDLNVAKLPAAAAPGQTYGQAGEQIAAQQQMPQAPQPSTAPEQQQSEPILPGSLGPLHAPTARPDEPLTAGAPFGPGSNTTPARPSRARPGAERACDPEQPRGPDAA
jgi:hypothetical protein